MIRHCRGALVKPLTGFLYHFRDPMRRVDTAACLASYVTVTAVRPRAADQCGHTVPISAARNVPIVAARNVPTSADRTASTT